MSFKRDVGIFTFFFLLERLTTLYGGLENDLNPVVKSLDIVGFIGISIVLYIVFISATLFLKSYFEVRNYLYVLTLLYGSGGVYNLIILDILNLATFIYVVIPILLGINLFLTYIVIRLLRHYFDIEFIPGIKFLLKRDRI